MAPVAYASPNPPSQPSKAIPSSTTSFASDLQGSRDARRAEETYQENLTRDRVFSFFDTALETITLTVSEKDKYSGAQLSQRFLAAAQVDELMTGKKCMRLDKLLAKVAPPLFQPPQYTNWVLFAIVTAKSEPKHAAENKGKYMRLTLSDFYSTVELMLFGKAFDKFWKTLVGNVVAILNPDIWPYKRTDSGYKLFNLSIKDDLNCLIEIGRARDFGTCPSVKRDGAVCAAPINRAKELHCHFHVELSFRKTTGKRMEFNSAVSMFGPGSTVNGTRHQDQVYMGGNATKGFKGKLVTDPYAPKVDKYDGNMMYFSNRHAGKAFFDDEYQNPKILGDMAAMRRTRKDATDEVALRRKLAKIKGGSSLVNSLEEDEQTREAKSKVAQTAFNPHVLNKIGFNPTRRLYESANHHLDTSKSDISKELDMLRAMSDTKQRKLTATKSDRVMKKKAWEANISKLKDYTNRAHLKGKYGDDFGDVDFSDVSESDSEIEIDFGGNAKFEEYQKVIGKESPSKVN
ncbi:hypothetical protein BABINDRAFT_42162 [Babjeviella inositovora NRRL Y-12698]|uniref:Uncharacterized protein n=1 Tax=Babjeviella inositovora NRRL Y-12698 TaxID=984486 RepID=A0A1E3QHF4_9ASCO|nr:uncharacterized protein BABINDRAFT_42162 [Babjeviella inositovora NRRL Y-12698]ODQ77125.1 hypothetical protein BABINDRAFT_42162 [Babjeviella inositovora NRRL Y-12698]